MPRRLIVEIIGDSSSLQRSFGEAGAASQGFGSKLGGLVKSAGVVLGAAALGGVVLLLDKSVKAALAGQVSQVKLDTALKATHQSVLKMTPALNAAQLASRKLGFTNDDTRLALAKLEVATGNTNLSIKDLGVAQDLARFKGIDLATASQTLAMAMTGSQRAVKQLGITVPPVTTYMDQLKLAHVNTSTAAGMQEVAHAKLLDKMATSKNIIQAVTDKVHGQADAYASTAQGGMAAFSAQIGNLEEGLGNKLLPILNSVIQWVDANWPAISKVFDTVFKAIGQGITAMQPVFNLLKTWIGDVATWIQDHWKQIEAAFASAFDTIKTLVNDVVTVVKAIWNEFGSSLVAIVKTYLTNAARYFTDLYHAIQGVVQLIDDLIHGRWKNILGDLSKIFSSALDALITVIKNAFQIAWDATWAVGRAIWDAFAAAVRGIDGLIYDAFSAIVKAIYNLFDNAFNAAYSVGKAIYNALASGITGLSGIASDAFNNAVQAVRNAFQGAWNAANTVGRQIIGGLTSGIAGVAGVVSRAISGIAGTIGSVAGEVWSAATRIGQQITSGVLSGIGDLAGAVLHKFTSLPVKILHFLGIKSPSKLMADQVGKPIAQGVIVGWTKGIADFSSVMSSHMQNAINNSAITITHRSAPTSPPTPAYATNATTGTAGGLTIMPGALVVHALDPRSAATAVVEAITVWERQNGQRYQRA